MPDVQDGITTQIGGANAAYQPSTIREDQYAKGLNIVCRGGKIKTRPPFDEISLTFDHSPDEQIFPTRKFQGGLIYKTINESFITLAVGGFIYLLCPDTGEVRNITLQTGRLNQYVDRLYFVQAEQFLIIQDGINKPIIVDGLTARIRDDEKSEIPVGTIMAYGHGRIFVKNSPNSFLAGDINRPNDPEAVLRFTETEYLNGGGAFQLASFMGEITAMIFSQALDTGTGNGPLIVMAEDGATSYRVQEPRSTWQDIDIAHIEFRGNGAASHTGVVSVHEDLLFRTWTGTRSFQLIREEAEQDHSFTNLAEEIRPFIDQETQFLLPDMYATYFDERFLYMVVADKVCAQDDSGNIIDDTRFKGIASIDFATVNGMTVIGENIGAAYDGVWTGVFPVALLSGLFRRQERAFIIGKDDFDQLRVYEISKREGNDNKDTNPINCRIDLRSMFYRRAIGNELRPVPFSPKEVKSFSLWVDRFIGDIDIRLRIKSDNTTAFEQVSVASIRAKEQIFNPPQTDPPQIGVPQGRPRLVFPALDPNVCDKITGRRLIEGFEIQFQMEWDGFLEFSKLLTVADENPTPVEIPCETEGKLKTETVRSDFDYNINRRLNPINA